MIDLLILKWQFPRNLELPPKLLEHTIPVGIGRWLSWPKRHTLVGFTIEWERTSTYHAPGTVLSILQIWSPLTTFIFTVQKERTWPEVNWRVLTRSLSDLQNAPFLALLLYQCPISVLCQRTGTWAPRLPIDLSLLPPITPGFPALRWAEFRQQAHFSPALRN